MTAEQRAGLSDAALAMTQPCIDELIKDISKRVQKAGAITDTAEYQIYRAQALGEGKKAIEQAVSKQIGISEEVIASLFEYVARELDINDFAAEHALENAASGNVIRKCGFHLVRYGQYSKLDGSETFDAAFYELHLKGES